MLHVVDTIFAPATAPGRAGVAIIRISGPEARRALERLTGRCRWAPRRATRMRLVDRSGELLDEGLALWFPGPASFTGEDVAELHLHGGRAVVGGVLCALSRCAGLRPAEAGEFTRRAFEHGKLDLTQAEALADLVAAETQAQRRQALRQFDGALSRLYDGWRSRLLGVMAHVEAAIDFSDEDLPTGLVDGAAAEVAAIADEIARHLNDGHRGERLRDGLSIVLVGPPNAGKSSMLNALVGREAAIVDGDAGTTRDVIEVPLELAGFPVVLADTAGLRPAEGIDGQGRVEREGVRRSRARAAAADIRLAVFDGALWPAHDGETAAMLDDASVAVINKADLGRVAPPVWLSGREALVVSALTGDGIDALRAALAERIGCRFEGGATPALTRVRHRQHLVACALALQRFATALAVETAAEELRAAAAALGAITGRLDVEQVLTAIFAEFCIGK